MEEESEETCLDVNSGKNKKKKLLILGSAGLPAAVSKQPGEDLGKQLFLNETKKFKKRE